MTVRLTAEERTLLVDSTRGVLEDSWPVEGGVERCDDATVMQQQARALAEMGLTSIGTDDGPGVGEAVLIMEELGRVACPAIISATIIANLLMDDTPDASVQEFLRGVQCGEILPALALGSFDGDRAAGSVRLFEGRITGSLAFVENAASATHLLVLADAPSGLAVLTLDGVAVTAEPGLAVPALSSIEVTAEPVIWFPLEADRLSDAAQLMRLLCGARALGSAQRGFDLALDHAKVRRQFGHVIGEFQAIQHKLVDCFSRLDGTRLLFGSAAAAYDRGDPAWRVLTDAVIAYAGPAFRQLALEVHHVLGAIGYAEEHEAPRHFRRIHADLLRFGGTARARAGLADYLLRDAA